MVLNASKIRELDVINVCDGSRLGWVCEFEIDSSCGKICAVIVSGRYFSLFEQKNTLRIPWEKIVCIGEDAILADCGRDAGRCREEKCRENKRGLFG